MNTKNVKATVEQLEKYIDEVCERILNQFSLAIKKYTGLDKNAVEEMMSGKIINGEEELNYPDHFDRTVGYMWECDEDVDAAVKYFSPQIHNLINAQAVAM